MRANEMP